MQLHLLLKRFFGIPVMLVMIASSAASAQDFTGVWTGLLYTGGNQLPYELVIGEKAGNLHAYSLIVFSIEGVENTGIKSMKVKARKKELSIEDDALLYNDYTTAGRKLTLYSTLSLEKEDTVWKLQGTFYTRSADRVSFKGTIALQKRKNSSETKLTTHLEKMELFAGLSFTPSNEVIQPANTTSALPGAAAIVVSPDPAVSEARLRQVSHSDIALIEVEKKVISPGAIPGVANARPLIAPLKAAADINSRETEVIRSIFFRSDSLVLSLYDNGEVDGDTVSIVMNNNVIIGRLGLTAASVTITYHIPPNEGDSLRLVMYAENLGRISPNTGVLVIQDGDERHQLRFEGDYKKNSAVILRRKRL